MIGAEIGQDMFTSALLARQVDRMPGQGYRLPEESWQSVAPTLGYILFLHVHAPHYDELRPLIASNTGLSVNSLPTPVPENVAGSALDPGRLAVG